MAEDFPQDAASAKHLVILLHGLWGNPVHLRHLRDTLHARRGDEGLYILLPKSNKDSFTYDGIEVGAERITDEIHTTLKELEAAGSKITKISIAGYSLGGLVARYVVGLMYKTGIFEHIQPTNFTTFATPHLGVPVPRVSYRTDMWNWLGAHTLSTSGQQMFLVDNFRGTGRPLLSIMADPDSIFVKGLSQFKHKSIYANTVNDKAVPFYTSAISRTDPFVDIDAVEVHYLPGQEHNVILDPSNPVSPKRKLTPEEQGLSWQERYIMSERTRSSIPFYAFLFSMMPIFVPFFFVNAAYQTYTSAQRVKLHEAGKLIDLKRYRIPLLEESQALQDTAVERLASHSKEEYLPTPPPEPTVDDASSSSTNLLSKVQHEQNDSPWPTLALTDAQFGMIDNLDRCVGFTKFPAHIQKIRHTHAAIVVRTPKEGFAEGKVVSAHWAGGFET